MTDLTGKVFSNMSVNEKVIIFNNTILNILSNFISHEILTCDDKDPFNKKIKGIIQEKKNHTFKAYCNNSSNTALKNSLRNLQVCLNISIGCAKKKLTTK